MTRATVTPIRKLEGAPAYRALADQVVREAIKNAFNEYFRAAVTDHPEGRSGIVVDAFIQALRARLEHYERAQEVNRAAHRRARARRRA